jgi:2-methylcitrate dehydratase PrpD
MMGFDVMQTRMAMGHAASTMAGMLKNRGSDTKGFVAGNAAMHGVMAAELVALGFTANDEIMDGDIGVGHLLGLEKGDPAKMLDGLGSWTMATLGSTMRLHACCGASHWSQDALQKIVRSRPVRPEEIARIEVEVPEFLMPMMPYDSPETGLQAKYSLQYDLATIVLDGRAGLHQYSDTAVRRPEARSLMEKVVVHPTNAGLVSRVVLTLVSGEKIEETVTRTHGNPADPLTRSEVMGKFHECAEGLIPLGQREDVISLCDRLEHLDNIRDLGKALRVAGTVQ